MGERLILVQWIKMDWVLLENGLERSPMHRKRSFDYWVHLTFGHTRTDRVTKRPEAMAFNMDNLLSQIYILACFLIDVL